MTTKLECNQCSFLSTIALIVGIISIFASGGALVASIGFVLEHDNNSSVRKLGVWHKKFSVFSFGGLLLIAFDDWLGVLIFVGLVFSNISIYKIGYKKGHQKQIRK